MNTPKTQSQKQFNAGLLTMKNKPSFTLKDPNGVSPYSAGVRLGKVRNKSEWFKGFKAAQEGEKQPPEGKIPAYYAGYNMGKVAAKSQTPAKKSPTKKSATHGSVLSGLTLEASWAKLKNVLTPERLEELHRYYKGQSEANQRKAIRRTLRAHKL